jgi:hypothetical protein
MSNAIVLTLFFVYEFFTRSHLREIRDRSVLRLFESNEVAAPQVLPGGPGVPQPLPQQGGGWDHDQSYFSEPEFDSEYQHQHIHKSKVRERRLKGKIEMSSFFFFFFSVYKRDLFWDFPLFELQKNGNARHVMDKRGVAVQTPEL